MSGLKFPTAPSPETSFSASSEDSRWGQGYMPNVPVVDQDGHTFRFYQDLIRGKKVIVNFIYTSCSQICPLTTSRMALLQQKLGDAVGRDFFIYSVSIDPEHDGPAELKKYADAFRAGPGWRFLTGTPENIAQVRQKLGERSKILVNHTQEILLGDDARDTWSHDSVFGDIDQLALSIRAMNPDFRVAELSSTSAAQPQATEVGPGQTLFSSMCEGCHTIGGGEGAGPDLKDVGSRRDHKWLTSFISRPDEMFAIGDPTAIGLAQKFPAVRMPALGLSSTDAEDVLKFIASRSKPKIAATSGESSEPLSQSPPR